RGGRRRGARSRMPSMVDPRGGPPRGQIARCATEARVRSGDRDRRLPRPRPAVAVVEAGPDEVREERMRRERLALELGMELDGHEPRMLLDLGDLHELAVRGLAG